MARTGIIRTLAVSALATVCLLPIARVHADVVTDWNMIALNATAVPPNSILQSRVLAIVHGAIYDAVHAVDRRVIPTRSTPRRRPEPRRKRQLSQRRTGASFGLRRPSGPCWTQH
jgi:hypothetical protein